MQPGDSRCELVRLRSAESSHAQLEERDGEPPRQIVVAPLWAGPNSSSWARGSRGRSRSHVELGGKSGLSNLGNTCFMNAALQCLSHTPDLTDFFLDDNWKADLNVGNPLGSGGSLAKEYAALLDRLWRGGAGSAAVSPSQFKRVISRFASQFEGYQQHDAQELAAFLLDGLHEDLNRVAKKPYIEDREVGEDENEEAVAAEAWGNYLKRDRSVVVDTFQGQLKSSVRCSTCGFERRKFDPFMYLSLPLPKGAEHGELTLEQCLHEFTAEEELSEDNLWRCPKCKDFRRATKRFQLWKLPPYLVVHLKRFKQSSSGRTFAKRATEVRACRCVGCSSPPPARAHLRRARRTIYTRYATTRAASPPATTRPAHATGRMAGHEVQRLALRGGRPRVGRLRRQLHALLPQRSHRLHPPQAVALVAAELAVPAQCHPGRVPGGQRRRSVGGCQTFRRPRAPRPLGLAGPR